MSKRVKVHVGTVKDMGQRFVSALASARAR